MIWAALFILVEMILGALGGFIIWLSDGARAARSLRGATQGYIRSMRLHADWRPVCPGCERPILEKRLRRAVRTEKELGGDDAA